MYFNSTTGEGNEFREIVKRALESGEERSLFRTEGFLGPPSVSADGRQLAFAVARLDPDRRTTVYVMPANGGEPGLAVQLLEGVESLPGLGSPVWIGNQYLLVVCGDGSDKHWIARVRVDDGAIEKLDVAMPNLGALEIHPDGRRIAFAAGQRSLEAWVMEAAEARR